MFPFFYTYALPSLLEYLNRLMNNVCGRRLFFDLLSISIKCVCVSYLRSAFFFVSYSVFCVGDVAANTLLIAHFCLLLLQVSSFVHCDASFFLSWTSHLRTVVTILWNVKRCEQHLMNNPVSVLWVDDNLLMKMK